MKKHKQKHIQSPKKENNNAPPDYRPSANRDNQTRSDVCFPLEEIISKQHTPRSTGYPVKLSPKKQKKSRAVLHGSHVLLLVVRAPHVYEHHHPTRCCSMHYVPIYKC